MDQFELSNVELITLPKEWIHKAAELAAIAFINSPGFVYIYRDCTSEVRQAELTWLFERNIELMYNKCPEVCFCGIDKSPGVLHQHPQGRLCCFFILADNETSEISLWAKIWAGILWMPFRIGLATMSRLLTVTDYADPTEESIATQDPIYGRVFLRLGRMVVLPEYQGLGVGSKCLGQALVQVADARKQVVVLGTQELRNVNFYTKLGFTVEKDIMFPPDADPEVQYRWWFMKRIPKSN